MTNPELVVRKLAILKDHLERIRRRRPATAQELALDNDRLDALSLSLLVAIQEAVDIAFHVASDEGWGVASSYAEAFRLIASRGVISEQLAESLGAAAALRNRIAHGYATVDAQRLWEELPTGLQAFDTYAIAIASFIAGATRT